MGDVRISAKSTLNTINRSTTVSVANPNLDGTGAISLVITATNVAVQIDTLTIKATGSTTQGMVRLFIADAKTTRLYREVEVQATTQSGTQATFCATLDDIMALEQGNSLYASTENAESFNIIADASEVTYCSC